LRKYKDVKVVEKKVIDVTCNWCGASCMKLFDKGNPASADIYAAGVSYVGGHFSGPYLADDTAYHFDLCEACLTHMFKQFKYPPQDFDGEPSYVNEEK